MEKRLFENLTDEELLTLENAVSGNNIDWILQNSEKIPKIEGFGLTPNGCLFYNDRQGFMAALMEKMFNDRAKYKKLMLEAKKRYEQTKTSEDEKLISRYHNLQMAKKIQLNSLYGALANEWFRWFNFDLAEAITTSGQLTIRFVDKKMNQYLNGMLKTSGVDYVIASDTDSVYLNMEELVKASGSQDEQKIIEALDKFCEEKIQPYLDKCFDELKSSMNSFSQKLHMKRETIANKGIWKAKKMYILNAWNVEGVQYSEPKLKLQGIEAVRSSTPRACRENIKKALEIIMNGSQSELQKFIEDFRAEFLTLPFEDVAFPRGVKGLTKYHNASMIYDKGTPIHVKGALLFNNILKQNKIKQIMPISDGDKIKFAYLKMPNPVKDTVIAIPDEIPQELLFIDKYIDRDMQFTKSFLEPLKSITDIIGWETEQKSTLEEFFA